MLYCPPAVVALTLVIRARWWAVPNTLERIVLREDTCHIPLTLVIPPLGRWSPAAVALTLVTGARWWAVPNILEHFVLRVDTCHIPPALVTPPLGRWFQCPAQHDDSVIRNIREKALAHSWEITRSARVGT